MVSWPIEWIFMQERKTSLPGFLICAFPIAHKTLRCRAALEHKTHWNTISKAFPLFDEKRQPPAFSLPLPVVPISRYHFHSHERDEGRICSTRSRFSRWPSPGPSCTLAAMVQLGSQGADSMVKQCLWLAIGGNNLRGQ